MSLLLQAGDFVTQHAWLAAPVDSAPVAPGTAAQGQANNIWGIVKWVGFVIGAIALGCAAIMMGISHQANRPNEGLNKMGAILGSLGALIAAPAVAGLITGT